MTARTHEDGRQNQADKSTVTKMLLTDFGNTHSVALKYIYRASRVEAVYLAVKGLEDITLRLFPTQ